MAALRTTAHTGISYSGSGSGSGSYTATLSAFTSAASTAEQTRDLMSSQVTKLLGELHSLSTVSWAGPARAAYNSAQTAWTDAHAKLMHSLTGIADGLRSTGQNYGTTEDANTGDINRARGGLA
jgi:WXG100 family type VII secretion target